jgi:hypothetical protein
LALFGLLHPIVESEDGCRALLALPDVVDGVGERRTTSFRLLHYFLIIVRSVVAALMLFANHQYMPVDLHYTVTFLVSNRKYIPT